MLVQYNIEVCLNIRRPWRVIKSRSLHKCNCKIASRFGHRKTVWVHSLGTPLWFICLRGQYVELPPLNLLLRTSLTRADQIISLNDLRPTRGQFHQLSTSCFCLCRFQKNKKTVKLSVFFTLLGSAQAKAAHGMLMKLTPGALDPVKSLTLPDIFF